MGSRSGVSSSLSSSLLAGFILMAICGAALGRVVQKSAPVPCPREMSHVFNLYQVCSREIYSEYVTQTDSGASLSGNYIISVLNGYCSHECQVYECLRERYNVDDCETDWKDDFYKGVTEAESVCDGQRLRPAVRDMLRELRVDPTSAHFDQCWAGGYSSISECSRQVRGSTSDFLGVENMWEAILEWDFEESARHVDSYFRSLAECVYDNAIGAGCDQPAAKMFAVISLDAHNSLLRFGINTTDLLLSIGRS